MFHLIQNGLAILLEVKIFTGTQCLFRRAFSIETSYEDCNMLLFYTRCIFYLLDLFFS